MHKVINITEAELCLFIAMATLPHSYFHARDDFVIKCLRSTRRAIPRRVLVQFVLFVCLVADVAALGTSPPKKKKRNPFPEEHLSVANEMVNRLEGAAVKLRSALATFRNHTLERLPGSEQPLEAHKYSSIPPPDSPFPTSFVNRHGYEAVCGNYLAALGTRQRKMASNELPPPGVVLAVYSPLHTEGIADFFKQAALAAGIAATWPDGSIAVHIEWLAAEPHLSATLQSAGLIDTWDSYGLDYLPGEATRDVASFGGSMTGSGELVRRCKSDWALHGCEVVDMKYVSSQFLGRHAEATANAFAMEFRHVFRTTVPPHDRRPLRTAPWHPDLAPACLLNGLLALKLDALTTPATVTDAASTGDDTSTGSAKPSEGHKHANAVTPSRSGYKSSNDDAKCMECEKRDFPTALRLMRSAQRLSVAIYFRGMHSEHHNQATSRESLLAGRLPGNRSETWPLWDRWAYSAAAAAALRLERTYSRALDATISDGAAKCNSNSSSSRWCCTPKHSTRTSKGEADEGRSYGTIPEVVWVVVSDDIALRETFCDEFNDPQNGRYVVSSGSAGRHSRPNLATTHPANEDYAGAENREGTSEECSSSGSSDTSTCSDSSSSTSSGSSYARSVTEAVQDWWLLGEADVAVLAPWRGDGASYPRTAVARTARLRSTFAAPDFMTRLQVLVERAKANSTEEAPLAETGNSGPTAAAISSVEGTNTGNRNIYSAPHREKDGPSSLAPPLELSVKDAEACPEGCLGGRHKHSGADWASKGTAKETTADSDNETCDCGETTPLGIWPLRYKSNPNG